MGFVFPEVVIRKVIDYGIKHLRLNKPAFDDLFDVFVKDELTVDYGPEYREQIWQWFSTTKIPVIQAWSFNTERIPCISVHLANESEDESKAAMNDFVGSFEDGDDVGTAVFTTMVDIGIHTARGGDYVLWLYYIVSYILFKYKPAAERLGLKLQTYSASDYSKDSQFMANNIWTRWVRFKCTTENFWTAEPGFIIDEVNVEPRIGQEPAWSQAVSLDVDLCEVDPTANKGIEASPQDTTEDDENVPL